MQRRLDVTHQQKKEIGSTDVSTSRKIAPHVSKQLQQQQHTIISS